MVLELESRGCHGTVRRALQLATRERYELVVLDLMLPELEGIAVLQGLMERRPDQRVLVLSALSDVDTKVSVPRIRSVGLSREALPLAELIAWIRARRHDDIESRKAIATTFRIQIGGFRATPAPTRPPPLARSPTA